MNAGSTTGLLDWKNVPKKDDRKATAEYQQHLSEALESDPTICGYSFMIWTLERLRNHLAQMIDVHLTTGQFADLLKQMDYVYRRPKADLSVKCIIRQASWFGAQ